MPNRGVQNLGQAIRTLTQGTTDADNGRIGQIIDDAIAAALKSVMPGDQTDKQVHDQQVKGRKAVNRSFSRALKRT